MSNDPRISRLRETLSSPLSLDKLDALTREFGALAQDRPDTLVFFVLEKVSERLSSALEGEAVSYDRFQELTAGITDAIQRILMGIEEGRGVMPELEELVVTLFRNLGLYNA